MGTHSCRLCWKHFPASSAVARKGSASPSLTICHFGFPIPSNHPKGVTRRRKKHKEPYPRAGTRRLAPCRRLALASSRSPYPRKCSRSFPSCPQETRRKKKESAAQNGGKASFWLVFKGKAKGKSCHEKGFLFGEPQLPAPCSAFAVRGDVGEHHEDVLSQEFQGYSLTKRKSAGGKSADAGLVSRTDYPRGPVNRASVEMSKSKGPIGIAERDKLYDNL